MKWPKSSSKSTPTSHARPVWAMRCPVTPALGAEHGPSADVAWPRHWPGCRNWHCGQRRWW
eukprot:3005268-Alexandrium_andersonii.AAC.1